MLDDGKNQGLQVTPNQANFMGEHVLIFVSLRL